MVKGYAAVQMAWSRGSMYYVAVNCHMRAYGDTIYKTWHNSILSLCSTDKITIVQFHPPSLWEGSLKWITTQTMARYVWREKIVQSLGASKEISCFDTGFKITLQIPFIYQTLHLCHLFHKNLTYVFSRDFCFYSTLMIFYIRV